MTASRPDSRPTSRRHGSRLDWLDGVRALAASYVVLHHVWLMSYASFPENAGPTAVGWLLYGHLAVAVFIVVSGFSLALVPLRHGLALPRGSLDFFLRRAWRILPSYWAALALSVLVVTLLTGPRTGVELTTRDVAVYALLVQDLTAATTPNGVFWSIAVEWHIYFLFPVVLLATRRWGAVAVAVLAAGLVLTTHVLGGVSGLVAKAEHLTPQFLVLFVLGVAAATAATGPSRPRWVPGLAVIVLALSAGFTVVVGPGRVVAAYFWVDLVVGLGVALLLTAVARGQLPRLRAVLSWRPLVAVGLFSYSLYLIHAPLLELVHIYAVQPLGLAPTQAFLVLLAVGTPTAFAGCYAFFLAFEQPFIRHRSPRALAAAVTAGSRSAVRPVIPAPRVPRQGEETSRRAGAHRARRGGVHRR